MLSSRQIDTGTLQDSKDDIERYVQQKQAFLVQKDVTDVRCAAQLVEPVLAGAFMHHAFEGTAELVTWLGTDRLAGKFVSLCTG